MIPKCGVKYRIGSLAPKRARWALWFWGYVVYHTTKVACEYTFGRLSYYEQEDAQIEPVTQRKRK